MKNKFQSIDYGLLGKKKKKKLDILLENSERAHISPVFIDAEGLLLHTRAQLHNPGDFSGPVGV